MENVKYYVAAPRRLHVTNCRSRAVTSGSSTEQPVRPTPVFSPAASILLSEAFIYSESTMEAIFNVFSRPFGHKASSSHLARSFQAESTSECPLFALLIGINTYKSERLAKLRGSTTDAEAFSEYLKNHLAVPASHIRLLLDDQASRSAIIDAFVSIRGDPRIKPGDPIFIFYAGHGGEAEAPSGWEAGGKGAKIQMLMPQNFSSEPGNEVPGIPDYTVAALLNQIAKAKGDNITVVFDSCHSASASRGNEPSANIIRRSANLPPGYVIPSGIDQNIWGSSGGTRGGGVPPGLRHLGLQSYVLLSACQSFESAQESGGRGFFSTSLLTLFRTIGPDKLKYSEIITRLDVIPNQNPQCEGLHKDRHIFNRKVVAPAQKFYTLRRTPDPMKLTMDAGLANGLSLGAEFSVYPRKDIKSQPLGNLRLEELQAFSSTVTFTTKEPTFALTQTAFAVQSKPGVKEALRLYLNPPNDKALLRLLFQGGTEESLLKHVRLIDSAPEDAHITISMEKHKVVMADPSLARFGKRTQIATLAPNTHEVARTLRSLSHYFWNLERGDNVSQLVNSLQFEFFKLEKSADMDLQFAPVGPSLYQNNVVELLVNEDDLYGIRLTNKTGRDIFPNLFYFDNSDFGIESYYTTSPVGAKSIQEAPLKKGGSLTLGYGSGGCAPWSYYLRQGETLDVGFLKLFVFTEPIDMSDIPQSSPFQSNRGVVKSRAVLERLWGTLVIPVVQRRPSVV